MTSGLPFDDFRELLRNLPQGDSQAATKVSSAFTRLPDGSGGSGDLVSVAEWLAKWSGRAPPVIAKPLVAVFAGTHGVARHITDGGDPTQHMVELRAAGGATLNQACMANDLGLKIFDLALDLPVEDITRGDALDERGCAATMAFGMEALADGTDLLVVGALGAQNDIAAAALLASLLGGSAGDWLGDGRSAMRKADLADQALVHHKGRLGDPFEALRRVGGREFAAIAGALLAARMQNIPVLLDGVATLAAAAVLQSAQPGALDHCLAAHESAEPGHARALAALGMKPLLDLGISAGDGTGAAVAAGVVKTGAQAARGALEVTGDAKSE